MSLSGKGKIFKYIQDHYKGVKIEDFSIPYSFSEFKETFERTLKHIHENKFRAIWIKIKPEQSEFIHYLQAEHGFGFQHATPEYLMMNKWLAEGKSQLPLGPSHHLAVGAIAIHPERDEILAIQENSGPAVGRWKLPGGLVDPKEPIEMAAVREVKEETGIDSLFLGFAGVREVTLSRLGAGDIYFYTLVQPISLDIFKCNREIKECVWLPIPTFLEAISQNPLPRKIIINMKNVLPYKISKEDPDAETKRKTFESYLLFSRSFKHKIGDYESQQYFHGIRPFQIPKF